MSQQVWPHDEGDGAGTFHTYDALQLGERPASKVHVLFPRDAGDRRFRVVIVNDGDTAFWPGGAYGHTWEIAKVLSRLGDAIEPIIVVAVHPIDRDHEYTHVDWSEGRRTFGGVQAYAAWLADSLLPFIRANYPVREGRENAAVLGSSHGGLAAFYTATRHPDAFGWAGCLSSSFFSGIDSLATGARPGKLVDSPIYKPVAGLLGDRKRRPKLWIDWGMRRDGGEHNSMVEMLAEMRSRELIELLVAQNYKKKQVNGPEDARGDADLFVHNDLVGGHDEYAWRYRFGLFARAFSPASS